MLDYTGFEDDLDDSDRLVRDTAREFVRGRIAPDIGDHWLEGTLPLDLLWKSTCHGHNRGKTQR